MLKYPKSRADMIINLDAEKVDFPNEKSATAKITRQHTNYEKKMIGNILQKIEVDVEEEED